MGPPLQTGTLGLAPPQIVGHSRSLTTYQAVMGSPLLSLAATLQALTMPSAMKAMEAYTDRISSKGPEVAGTFMGRHRNNKISSSFQATKGQLVTGLNLCKVPIVKCKPRVPSPDPPPPHKHSTSALNRPSQASSRAHTNTSIRITLLPPLSRPNPLASVPGLHPQLHQLSSSSLTKHWRNQWEVFWTMISSV